MSQGSEEEGRPATASPHVGSATHGQAAAKAPYKGAVGYGQGQPAREAGAAHRGSGLQARSTPLVRAAAHRGGACGHGRLRPARRGSNRRRAHPLVAWCLQRGSAAGLPQGAIARFWPCSRKGLSPASGPVTCAGAAATATVVQMGQEGLGHPF
ncbi:hypothetical protein BHM03_00017521 [Ensete ventricosum]|nr:hypothetical protein BHM03_00017521 [Ensete ventricosum]